MENAPPTNPAGDQRLPLSGTRVLELGHIVAGPFAGQLLSDLGAEVVKVEPPSGDGLRSWPPFIDGPNGAYSHNFAVMNRGKQSIELDLKSQDGMATLSRLVQRADVVLENYRTGTLDRLGLSIAQAQELNPRLIWCSVSGFGRGGPLATAGAYDVVVQGYSGLMSVTGTPGGEPVKCGVPVADFVAGLFAGISIVAALRQRDVTGVGNVLDCSMFASLLSISALQVSQYWGTDLDPTPLGSAHPRNAPYRAFDCADGYITVAAGNDALWRRFCAVIQREDLIDDPLYGTQTQRAANQEKLLVEVSPTLRQQTRASWLSAFSAAGVPCGPVNTFSEALAEPQLAYLDLVKKIVLPNDAPGEVLGFPVSSDQWHTEVSAPPGLGEHTDDVLTRWLT